jgi:hypothetical protein
MEKNLCNPVAPHISDDLILNFTLMSFCILLLTMMHTFCEAYLFYAVLEIEPRA